MISSSKNSSWFTLVEMMIVIAIIGILFMITLFPYGYYMQRWYVERAADGLSQEWILAHKAIRWWIEFDPIAGTHARLFFVFERGTSDIESYLLSGATLPDLTTISTDPNIIRKYKTFSMENGVQVIGFTGSLLNAGDKVGYMISPPYGDGVFFTGSVGVTMTGAHIIVWYDWADTITGRAREVLLRTYLH